MYHLLILFLFSVLAYIIYELFHNHLLYQSYKKNLTKRNFAMTIVAFYAVIEILYSVYFIIEKIIENSIGGLFFPRTVMIVGGNELTIGAFTLLIFSFIKFYGILKEIITESLFILLLLLLYLLSSSIQILTEREGYYFSLSLFDVWFKLDIGYRYYLGVNISSIILIILLLYNFMKNRRISPAAH